MFSESRTSELVRKVGGKFHLKLNIGLRPIANKYHEGKMKRTLKRELKVFEIAEREANGTSPSWRDCALARGMAFRLNESVAGGFEPASRCRPSLCVNVGSDLRKTPGGW